jgi:hypothetical protein
MDRRPKAKKYLNQIKDLDEKMCFWTFGHLGQKEAEISHCEKSKTQKAKNKG